MREKDFIAVKSIQGLSAGKRDIYIFFNLILSVARRDIRCVTTAKESSLNSPPSEKGRREG